MAMTRKTDIDTSSASTVSSMSTDESQSGCFSIYDYITDNCFPVQLEDSSFLIDEAEEIITTRTLRQPQVTEGKRTRLDKSQSLLEKELQDVKFKAAQDLLKFKKQNQSSHNTTLITSSNIASQIVPDHRRKLATFQWILADAVASRQSRINKKVELMSNNEHFVKEKDRVLTESKLMKLTIQLSSSLLMENMLQDNIFLLQKKIASLEQDSSIETRAHEIKIGILQELIQNAEETTATKISTENLNLMKESAELTLELEKMTAKLSFSERLNYEMESDVRILQDAIDSLSKAYNNE